MTSHGHGRLVLVRHGQTQWSRDGRHTGLTDLPLLPEGEADAASFARTSPASTSASSCPPTSGGRCARPSLAGLSPGGGPDLREWDYGGAEGRTTEEVREDEGVGGPSSTACRRGRPRRDGRGGRRARLARPRPGAAGARGRARGPGRRLPRRARARPAHPHRGLARALARLAAQAQALPGSLSLLGRYREDASVAVWNVPAAGLDALV